MIRRLVACGLLALIEAPIGAGLWAYAHRGYPHAVHYLRANVLSGSSDDTESYTVQQWINPAAGYWRRDT